MKARRRPSDSSALAPSIDWHPLSAAPAERLALLRILVGAYTLAYLLAHAGMFAEMSGTAEADFRPVGILRWMEKPISADIAQDVFAATLGSTILFTVGWLHRPAALLHSALLLLVMTYRNSWSMIYHSQNLVVFHTIVLAIAPSANVWSVDAWRRSFRNAVQPSNARRKTHPAVEQTRTDIAWQYGWAIWLISCITVTTYWLAGVAKILGPLGWSWATGAAMRDQIAVDAIRKEVLSVQDASTLAFTLYPYAWIFTLMGVGTLVLEIGAPLVMLRRRWAMVWAVLAVLMHWGIFFVMGITFRYQLCGLVVASFFPIERPVVYALHRWSPAISKLIPFSPDSARFKLLLVLLMAGVVAIGWVWMPRTQSNQMRAHVQVTGERMPEHDRSAHISQAIDQATAYLRTHVQDNGRWIYRADLTSPEVDRATYNILRHAGAIYALSTSHQRAPHPGNIPVIQAAVAYLNAQIRPLPNRPDQLAVWSDVDYRDPTHPRTAKLGGTGLGLVALLTAEQAASIRTDPTTLQGLGNFLLSMQEASGKMRSKWIDGPDDERGWESLYYPGEAALGLVLLSDRLRDDRYRLAAQRALLFLSEERKSHSQAPADHWALLATHALIASRAVDTANEPDETDRQRLIDHAAQIGRSMLAEQLQVVSSPLLDGCFTPDGRTTPTATRLEGLLAAHPLLRSSPDHALLAEEMNVAIQRGIAFLLRSQVVHGPWNGGVPRAIGRWDGALSSELRAANELSGEIRVDYVQHALSAFMAYETFQQGESARPGQPR